MGVFDFIFGWMCKRVFKQVDVNDDGVIDALEVEVAVLKLYNLVNKRLPGWSDPPSRPAILDALKAYDVDHNGTLDEKEFQSFAKNLVKSGPDAFFSRVGKNALVQTAVMPGLAVAVKEGLKGTQVANAPLAVLAPSIGVVFNAVRALVPV